MVNLGNFFYTLGMWLQGLLMRAGLSESGARGVFSALVAALLPLLALLTAVPLIWLERKWIARLQDRDAVLRSVAARAVSLLQIDARIALGRSACCRSSRT